MRRERNIPKFLAHLNAAGIAGLEPSPGEYLDAENSTISAREIAKLNDYGVRRMKQITDNISRRCGIKKVEVAIFSVPGYWQVRVFNKNVSLMDFMERANGVVKSSHGKVDYKEVVLELIGKYKIEFYYAWVLIEERNHG